MKITGLLLVLLAGSFWLPKRGKIVQFDIGPVLNARPVTTFGNSKLTTWKTGIDGGGTADGYLTQSAAAFNCDSVGHALPDNPLIEASSAHPEIQLHYANTDSVHYQACSMRSETSVIF